MYSYILLKISIQLSVYVVVVVDFSGEEFSYYLWSLLLVVTNTEMKVNFSLTLTLSILGSGCNPKVYHCSSVYFLYVHGHTGGSSGVSMDIQGGHPGCPWTYRRVIWGVHGHAGGSATGGGSS